ATHRRAGARHRHRAPRRRRLHATRRLAAETRRRSRQARAPPQDPQGGKKMNDNVERAAQALSAVVAEVRKVVAGQQEVIDQAITGLLSGGHVLVEGVPGLGKTLLVKALSKTIGGTLARIQFTPDLMPSDVTGHTLYDPSSGKFATRKGPVFAHFV